MLTTVAEENNYFHVALLPIYMHKNVHTHMHPHTKLRLKTNSIPMPGDSQLPVTPGDYHSLTCTYCPPPCIVIIVI